MSNNVHKDKMAVIQVLGGLIKKPLLLFDDNYKLNEQDFPERFHRIVFGAIDTLVKNGAHELNHIAIDDYISHYPKQYKVFTDIRGLEYLVNAQELADVNNFDYYYKTLKKFSLLNQLAKKGFDTSDIYNSSLVDLDEYAAMQKKFDDTTPQEIITSFEKDILELKTQYCSASNSTGCQAGREMESLKERYKQAPEMGMPMCSQKFTTIARGRRLKKLYLKTSPSGFGKTRISVGDACCVSIPEIYEGYLNKWKNTGCKEPTLFITTELEIDEIQTMIMAYVSEVPEEHILDGRYIDDEEQRVERAIEIIKDAPLYIEHIPNFNVDDIEHLVKQYKLQYNIGYVFFDYIFTSIKILSETALKARGIKMREDNVLIMFIDRIKTLCNELNIHFDTSSQTNGDWKESKNPDQNLIRGAKGLADKVDVGCVILPLTNADKDAIRTIIEKGFVLEPNLVYHIYKVRRGKINRVKLFVYFDYSTCRTTDLFVTDTNYNLLNVESTDIEAVLATTEESIDDEFEFDY